MKRFLCLSLCLGLMASACKKKYTQDDLDKARAEGKASASGSGSGSGTTAKKKDKTAVLKACLPMINTHLRGVYSAAVNYFVFRRSTVLVGTAASPNVIAYTEANFPLAFAANTTTGLGSTAAAVTTNLNAMAEDTDMAAQFVSRTDGGYKTHISINTVNIAIAQPAAVNTAPAAPAAGTIIYKRDSLAVAGQRVSATVALAGENVAAQVVTANGAGGDQRAGWYECAVDKDDNVTFIYTKAPLTAAAA